MTSNFFLTVVGEAAADGSVGGDHDELGVCVAGKDS